MKSSDSFQTSQINRQAIAVTVMAVLLVIGLVVMLSGFEGPASGCEARGGYYTVGPGGETACVDPENFLPMPEELPLHK